MNCGEVDSSIDFGTSGSFTTPYKLTLHYQGEYIDGEYHAGYGYILVSDIPDTGIAGVVKDVLEDAGETRVYLECESHRGCTDCKYAKPLVSSTERTYQVYVKFKTSVTSTSTKKYIDIDIEAADNSSMSCPSWYDQDIPVKWKVTVSKNSTTNEYTFKSYVDGNQVG